MGEMGSITAETPTAEESRIPPSNELIIEMNILI